MVNQHLDDLKKIRLLDHVPESSYKIKFKGDFRLQSFASHGVILSEGKIFKVCCIVHIVIELSSALLDQNMTPWNLFVHHLQVEFDELLDLSRVVRYVRFIL